MHLAKVSENRHSLSSMPARESSESQYGIVIKMKARFLNCWIKYDISHHLNFIEPGASLAVPMKLILRACRLTVYIGLVLVYIIIPVMA